MKTIVSIQVMVLLLGTTFARTQAQGNWPKTLYVFNSYGDISSYTEYDDVILLKEEREAVSETDSERVDTLKILKRIDSDHYLMQRMGAERMGILKRDMVVKDSIYSLVTSIEGTDMEEVLKRFKESGVADWSILMGRQLFTKAKVNALQKAPGMDQIQREDLITALSWRKEIGELLQAYLKDNKDAQSFRLYRMVQNYRDQKLVQLGYNPYKQVVYNWEKQFEGDEEVLQLLTAPVSFD